ncbi:hypothetical protein BCV71DRAFT_280927 [Rhizopus microsporus]|uniref:Uncharacterized protein n=1 Tax=Rhizopus microsporus TaxID=58291 RepID=A0A1X0RKE7_RHIZD|nr:hypothetical protein BCV71DRAFT_280927 [Rhizopus microsporus]
MFYCHYCTLIQFYSLLFSYIHNNIAPSIRTFRERVAASRRRRRVEDEHEETDVATRPRGRPRTIESSDAESRSRGRLRAEPAVYISQLSRLRPLDLGRMDKECSHCHALHWIDERQKTSSLSNSSWESCCKRGSVQLLSSCLTHLNT